MMTAFLKFEFLNLVKTVAKIDIEFWLMAWKSEQLRQILQNTLPFQFKPSSLWKTVFLDYHQNSN